MKTNLDELIQEQEFDRATTLVKTVLRERSVIDARFDDQYALMMDSLGEAICGTHGREAEFAYWEELLAFFESDIDSSWGRTHKGHFYWRLTRSGLALSLERMRPWLERALKEDSQLDERYQEETGYHLGPEQGMVRYPSYSLWFLVRLFSESAFDTNLERERFFRGLADSRLDCLWGPTEADERRLLRVREQLFPSQYQSGLCSLHRDLGTAYALGASAAIMELSRSLLERVLAALLTNSQRDLVTDPGVTSLDFLNRALEEGLLKSEADRSTCLLVFDLPARALQLESAQLEYPLNDAVRTRIAKGSKILLDDLLIRLVEALQ